MTGLTELTLTARGLTFPALACGEGPLVLCLHGFPDCLRTFHAQLPALSARGYRVVAPALRGYAPSCIAEPASHNVLEAARDTLAIMETLGESRAHLVGHDWGAAVAYAAAALSPASLRSVCTMAVPHPLGMLQSIPHVPRQVRRSWYMLFMQLPQAGRALAAADFALLDKLWRDWSPGFVASDYERHEVKSTFALPGVTEAALDYYRNLFALTSDASRELRELLARRITVPVLALTGENDGCIDTRIYDFAMAERYFADLTVERMRGVGHFLHQEAPERVNARLTAWFARHA